MTLGLSVLFALFLDASIGSAFISLIVAAPLFSFIVTLVLKLSGKITVEVETSDSIVYKSDILKLKVRVKNKHRILPVPLIVIKLIPPENFYIADDAPDTYRVSVMPRSETAFEINYRARYWGTGKLGVKSAILRDYMNFFTFNPFKNPDILKMSAEVKVFPEIPDVPANSPIVKSVRESKFSDDAEETKEADGLSPFNGTPGYTHREYVEGDPIKRINWKLSSKKDSYLIRLDDEIESIRQVIVLDSVGNSGENRRALDERAVEGVLAMVFSLTRLGLETAVWYNAGNDFVSFEAKKTGDTTALQTELANYRFLNNESQDAASDPQENSVAAGRIPADVLGAGGVLLYTSNPDIYLASELEEARRKGITATAVVSDAGLSLEGISDAVWRLNEDYTAELL